MHRIPVAQIMTQPPIAIRPEAQVADAGDLMDTYHIRRLPVVDEEGCLLGIITDSDVLEAETAGSVLNSYDPDADAAWLTVEEIMTTEVITTGPDETMGQVVIKLMENKVGGLPVVVPDATDPRRLRVVGVISETDVYRMIAEAWRQEEAQQVAG
jgi:acetoin utilization protein AcuB